MKKTWLWIAAMAAAAAALGLFAWLKPPKPQPSSQPLSAITNQQATSVRLTRKLKLPVALEKRNGEWMMIEPHAAPAEDFQVLRLLTILDAKSSAQYPADKLAKFELDMPQAELFINNQRFAFGAINTVTQEQYVLAGNTVHAVGLNHAAAFPADAAALLRKRVFTQTEIPITFTFDQFTVANADGKWTITPPADVSQDEILRWVAMWREASSLRGEAYDAAKPLATFTVTLKDNIVVPFNIVQREPELILARPDIGLRFVFTAEVGRRMLQPPTPDK